MPKRIPEETKKSIADTVRQEIDQHKAGELERFTPITEFSKKYQICRSTLSKILHESISEEDREYRTRALDKARGKIGGRTRRQRYRDYLGVTELDNLVDEYLFK